MALEVFSFGACLLSAPLIELIKSDRVSASWRLHGKTSGPAVYTLDEALQLLRFMRREMDIPDWIRALCAMGREEDNSNLSECFDAAKGVIIEINSPVAIRYSRFALCRSEVIGLILNRFKSTPELAKASNAWYNQGLMGENAIVREETAQRLILAMQPDMPDFDLANAVLVDSRPHRRDLDGLVEGLAELRDAFRGPLGVVTYTHQYMPDGRPLPWPADFVEQTITAAERLSLPVFNPSEFVKSFGASRALMPDRVHYQPEFSAALAEPLWDFIQRLAEVSLPTLGRVSVEATGASPVA